jgi:hypothetical protein
MASIACGCGSVSCKISSRVPDYFKIPRDGVIEVGFRVEI